MANLKTERDRLETCYREERAPVGLIIKILVFGTLGVFLAVLSMRVIAPDKIPHIQIQIVYPG